MTLETREGIIPEQSHRDIPQASRTIQVRKLAPPWAKAFTHCKFQLGAENCSHTEAERVEAVQKHVPGLFLEENPSSNAAVQSRPATCCEDHGPGTERARPERSGGGQGLVGKPAQRQGAGTKPRLRKCWLLGEYR